MSTRISHVLKSRRLCSNCHFKIHRKSCQIFKSLWHLWWLNYFLLRSQFSYSFMLEMCSWAMPKWKQKGVLTHSPRAHGYTPPDGPWHLPPWFHYLQKDPGYISPAHSDLIEEKTVYSVHLNNHIPYCFIMHCCLLFLQHKNVPFLSEGLWWLQASSSYKNPGFSPRKSSSKCSS